GNLLVTGALDATGPANLGAKSGNGGQIVLRSNSSKAFEVGSGATVNGVTGQLVANGSATGGDGGKIEITNFGSGGVSITSPASISVAAPAEGGNGGEIKLAAPQGRLDFNSGTLSANATAGDDTTAAFDGGTLDLSGQSLRVPGNPPLSLNANAAGAGKGGTVKVNLTGINSSVTLGTGSGHLSISATGGSLGSTGGDGGTIDVAVGGSLTVNSFSAGPLGDAGIGASLAFVAGGAAAVSLLPATLIVNTNLNVAGVGNG